MSLEMNLQSSITNEITEPFFTVTHPSNEPSIQGRCGLLRLPHADVQTPVFMPVGTQATVKAIPPQDLESIGYNLILGNTYHLHLRPGEESIAALGGLHRFSGWRGAMLTDSGGFQVFSLKGLRKITEEGVLFQSHIDGSSHMFTSETVMKIQRDIGADIIMAWDECAPYPSSVEYQEKAMNRTHSWLLRCICEYNNSGRLSTGGWPQALFGIVQGGVEERLRRESSQFLTSLDLPGYAVGGLAVGEDALHRLEAIKWCTDILPKHKPRYLMGVGLPTDILDAVSAGIDMFDCVLPTRNARNAQIFTTTGTLNLRNSKFREDTSPLDPKCKCAVCQRHTKAYVHHLFRVKEMLGAYLTTYHNLFFYHNLMQQIRDAIQSGSFVTFKETFVAEYLSAEEEPQDDDQ